MNQDDLLEDNKKIVEDFGAEPVSDLDEIQIPDVYTFQKGLIYSHRDFGEFFEAVKDEDKECAIVSGFNPSGTMHLGHRAVFDTNLYFQEEYGLPVFIPLSDDETYVSGKVDDQDEAFKNAMELGKELLAYGFDPGKTYIIIDSYYTSIYNLAIKYSKKLTESQVRSAYGYEGRNNPGEYFYSAVQSSHILLPIERFDKDKVLVPIGPDEDVHLRISRDIAQKLGLEKPAAIHTTFVPGLDGKKMSSSKDNYIGLNEELSVIKEKVNRAYSGGHVDKEKHRKYGGNPEEDIPIFYLEKYFLDEREVEKIKEKYSRGEILSGEVKQILFEKVSKFITEFQVRQEEITDKKLKEVLLDNPPNSELFNEISLKDKEKRE